MPIKDSKTRTMLTIEKELKTKLEIKAKQESRSFNNLVEKILKDYIDKEEASN